METRQSISGGWIMMQALRHVCFIHRRVSAESLRPHVPGVFQLETFDSAAWISIVIFNVSGVYPRGLPAISCTPPFTEINVRTYIQYNGRPGVYFLSVDVNHWLTAVISKNWFRLPCWTADMSFRQYGDSYHCRSSRKEAARVSAAFEGAYRPAGAGKTADEGTLASWLTARYRYFTADRGGRIYCGEMRHAPWKLQPAEAEIGTNTLLTPYAAEAAGECPLLHYSPGVDAFVWNRKRGGEPV